VKAVGTATRAARGRSAALSAAWSRLARRPGLLAAGFIVLIALATLYVQYRGLLADSAGRSPREFIENDLVARHDAILEGTVGDPWRYRLLSEWIAEGFLDSARAIGFGEPAVVGFLSFRALQNIAIFALAWMLFRRFGFGRFECLLGLALVAWGMTQALLHAALSFNTWSDLVFYLTAAVLILDRRYAWIPLLTVLATLNRETAGLIPVMLMAVAVTPLGVRTPQGRRAMQLGVAALVLWATTYGVLRLAVGPSFFIYPNEQHPGWDLFGYNVGRGMTWDHVFQTLNVLPLLALLAVRRWPAELKAFTVAIVPAWIGIHVFTSVLAESRLLLVPHVLVFVPGVLAGLGAARASPEPGARPAS
jgi:hypothetical protein